jgi:hypothetical protein
MFIPIWLTHTIATIIFLLVVYFWGLKTDGDWWDFTPILKVPVCIIFYLIYWLIMK